jgi:cytoskeleton protein RodZ
MFEIGNSLREARERQGLEYPQIELATKIRAKYIRALEDEHFEVLPTGTYIKGFLRSYAEFLGLDGHPGGTSAPWRRRSCCSRSAGSPP